jgi:cytochrome c1
MGRQKFIAGLLPNTPENLAAWIRDARRYDAHTAMPSTLISKAQSRDIAAYLYTIGR